MGNNSLNNEYENGELDEASEVITIEQISNVLEEAKKIILFFVKEHYGEEILNKVSSVIEGIKIDIDSRRQKC